MDEKCPACGNLLHGGACPQCTESAVFRTVQRDMVLLAVLAVAAVAMFIAAQKLAALNRGHSTATAAEQYQKGTELLAAGKLDPATQMFREAAAKDRDSRKYLLALANALSLRGENSEAQRVLFKLREEDPENGEVNVALARIATKTGDIPAAQRFYENALSGIWPVEVADQERNRVRTEFIRFLVRNAKNQMALSETLALSSNLPPDAAERLTTGRLFLQLADARRARDQFARYLSSHPGDADALAGMGEAEFELGEYRNAQHHLELALKHNPRLSDAESLLRTIKAVLENDPLAPNLPAAERRKRLAADLQHVRDRLDGCSTRDPSLASMQGDAGALLTQLQSGSENNLDTLRSGVALAYRAETATRTGCGPVTEWDQALVRIGQNLSGEAR